MPHRGMRRAGETAKPSLPAQARRLQPPCGSSCRMLMSGPLHGMNAPAHAARPRSVRSACVQAGLMVAADASPKGRVSVWSTASWRRLCTVEAGAPVSAMAVNHQYIAVGTAAGRVRVWARTGSEGEELSQLLQVRWREGGGREASCSWPRRVGETTLQGGLNRKRMFVNHRAGTGLVLVCHLSAGRGPWPRGSS